MKQHKQIWLPDGENHLTYMLDRNVDSTGRGRYQYHKYLAAMKYVKQCRRAIDVGSHVGLWSMHLARDFESLYAFEPVQEHVECFIKNVMEGPDWDTAKMQLYPCALSSDAGTATMVNGTKGSSGDTYVMPGNDVQVATLDSFNLNFVDFIKIDCEGYELFVLRGAEETLIRNRPAIIVEQKPGFAGKFNLKDTEAVDYLVSLGAVLHEELEGDYILSWED